MDGEEMPKAKMKSTRKFNTLKERVKFMVKDQFNYSYTIKEMVKGALQDVFYDIVTETIDEILSEEKSED